MRSIPLFCLLLLSVVAVCADPAPAQIYKLNDKGQRTETGAFMTAFVAGETVDGIEFAVDDPKSPNHLTLKYGTYQVEYGESNSPDYMRARNLEEAGTYDKAYESYVRTIQVAKYFWVRESAIARGAQMAVNAKKLDEAIALATQLEKEAPRSVKLKDALMARGQALAAKGDNAGAAKTYESIAGMAKEWGEGAAILGARGQAGLLAADKKFAEAAEVLNKLIIRIGKTAALDDLAPLALELAEDQILAGKSDEAIATLQTIVYRDCNPQFQAAAHLAWGRVLATKADLPSQLAAFDQAALASALKGADGPTLTGAKQLAIAINEKLAKDPTLSPADKAEYKRNLGAF
jgi:tetratricopeptide (TPR) repeat protein